MLLCAPLTVGKALGLQSQRNGNDVLVRPADGGVEKVVADPRSHGDEPIRVVDHDPAWPRLFGLEAAALDSAIGPWVTGGIHHVGSTAVPATRERMTR